MRNIRPLDTLLPRTRQGILAAVFVQPGKAWYISELARRMKVPPSSLQRELYNLTRAGILQTHRQGRMAYYRANVGSPLYPELRGLLLKTAGLVDVVASALKPLAKKVRVAFIYGSIASGTEKSDSDIDLMVVGTLLPMELSRPLRTARDLIGREINPTVYSPLEFEKKRLNRDHFLTRVLDKPKLFVIGTGNDLGSEASSQIGLM